MMEKLSKWIERVIGPVAFKISRNVYINAISACFATILPIVIVGSFASMFAGMNISAYQEFITETGIKATLNLVMQFTTNLLSVYLVSVMAYHYIKKKYPNGAILVGFVALAAFLLITPLVSVENQQYISFEFLGAKGMLMALVVGLLVGKIFELCYEKKIYIRMPDGIPPVIAYSFKAIVPAAILLGLACLISVFTREGGGIQAMFYNLLSAPFNAMGDSLIAKLCLDLMVQILWFFGLHGGNVMSAITQVLYQPGTLENIANYAAGEPLTNIFTMGFRAVVAGAAPMNIAIIIMCIRSKKKEFKEFGKVSFLPTLFGISEPIRFGLPIVLNPYFFIPTIVTTLMDTTVIYALFFLVIRPPPRSTQYNGLPYIFGVIVNIGVVPGILVSIGLFIINWIVVYPFFKIYEKQGMSSLDNA